MTEEIRVHISPTIDSVAAVGLTEGAMGNMGFLVSAAEYAVKVSADNSPSPVQTLDAIGEQVRSIHKAMKGEPIKFSQPDPDHPMIYFRVTSEPDFKSKTTVVIGATKTLDKKITDRCIDVAAPIMLYMVCLWSKANFEKALNLVLEGAKKGYTTVFQKVET